MAASIVGTMSPATIPLLYRAALFLGRRVEHARLFPSADGCTEIHLEAPTCDVDTFTTQRVLRVFTVDQGCVTASKAPVLLDRSTRARIPSPHGVVHLHVCKDDDDKKPDALELWVGSVRARRKPLKGVCGQVYVDGVFGEPSFSPDGKKVVMIAEAHRPAEYASFFDGDGAGDGKGEAGDKFVQRPSLGERLVGKEQPVVVIYDLETDTLKALDAADLGLLPGEQLPAHVAFDPSGTGLLYSAYHLGSFKHGLSACLNRPTAIYYWTADAGPRCLTPGSFLALRPVLNQAKNRLVFLHRQLPFGEHSTAFELASLPFPPPAEAPLPAPTPVVESKASAPSGDADECLGVYGFHDDALRYEILGGADGEDVLWFQTMVAGEAAIFAQRLTPDGHPVGPPTRLRPPPTDGTVLTSLALLRARDRKLIVSSSSLTSPPQVHLVVLSAAKDALWLELVDNGQEVAAALAYATPPVSNACTAMRASLSGSACIRSKVRVDSGAEAVLVQPRAASARSKCPLVVQIHGGPHSASLDAFDGTVAMLLSMGVAVLRPNYRGSIGFGEDYCSSLSGRAGDADVADCAELTRAALAGSDSLDESRVAVLGASHGGFVSAWLVGSPAHKALFKTAVVWNPVTDIGAMLAATDIPDWCVFEGLGRKWPWAPDDAVGHVWPMSEEDLGRMYRASPMSVVDGVDCETLVVLGTADQRVPPFNGREWAWALRQRGRPVKVYEYPGDGHALSSEEAAAHVAVTIVTWLTERLHASGGGDRGNL